jgi:hypothetical protein
LDLYGLAHPDIARLEAFRGSLPYGEAAAAIAHREGVHLVLLAVCGEGANEACLDFTSHIPLVVGVARYLLGTGAYALAYLRVPANGRVPVLVRKDSVALAGPIDVCGEVVFADPRDTQAVERTDVAGRIRRVGSRLWRRVTGGS